MDELIKVFVTNLGKYTEGYLIGEWLSLPCEVEEIDEIMKKIGINEHYEEYFITDYESDVFKIGEYTNIYELNDTLKEIVEICDNKFYCKNTLVALAEAETDDPATMLDYLQNYEIYFYDGMDLEDVGREHILSCYQIPEELLNYFDFASYTGDWYGFTETSVGVIEIN